MLKIEQVRYCVISTVVFAVSAMVISSLFASSAFVIFFPRAFAQSVETSADFGGQKIVQQGIATSSPDPLPGHESHQSITLLRLTSDNKVYSGRVTFTATQPVEVQIIHRDLTNASTDGGGSSIIPDNFGKLPAIQLPNGGGQVMITNVVPKFTEGATGTTFAASVPYSGNAVALHNLEGKPFAAVFTVTADVLGPAERVDKIGE